MSSAALAVPSGPTSLPRVAGRVVRWLAAAALVAACVLAVLREETLRHLEAHLAGVVTRLVFGREVRVMTDQPVFAFERVAGDDTTWFALHVTQQCSALFFLVPLALIAAFVLVTGRSSPGILVVATLGTAALLEAVNMLRVEIMVFAATRGGTSVFGWVHDTLGSALMLGGFTVALVIFFRLGFLGRRRAGRARPDTAHRTEEQP